MVARLLTSKMILLIAGWLMAGRLAAQNQPTDAERKVVGTWVQRHDSDAPAGSAELPRSLFVFEADHHFTQVPDTSATKITHVAGTWNLSPTHLTLAASAMTDSLLSEPIVWVTDDLFYTMGKEDAAGSSVFAYFQRVNGKLKRRLQLKGMLQEARLIVHP